MRYTNLLITRLSKKNRKIIKKLVNRQNLYALSNLVLSYLYTILLSGLILLLLAKTTTEDLRYPTR